MWTSSLQGPRQSADFQLLKWVDSHLPPCPSPQRPHPCPSSCDLQCVLVAQIDLRPHCPDWPWNSLWPRNVNKCDTCHMREASDSTRGGSGRHPPLPSTTRTASQITVALRTRKPMQGPTAYRAGLRKPFVVESHSTFATVCYSSKVD